MQASTSDAFKLMMDGSEAFSHIEQNGMRIDVDYLDRMIIKTAVKIKQMESDLRHDDVFTIWRKIYGTKADLGSRKQLGNIIFKEMGIECKNFTKAGNPKTDAAAFENIDIPFVKKWNNFESLKKLRSTNLIGVRREVVDGFIHPFFNLHTAITYRSSSSQPNFQNIPHRDPKQAKLVRRAFIPRKNHVLVEVDYGGMEWRIASCYSQDDKMVEDCDDPHTMWASKCYLGKSTPKDIRQAGKNQFVFPQLYGSFYKKCAPNLWESINSFETKKSILDKFEEENIHELGLCDYKQDPRPNTYENHIKNVENKFWKRYKIHDKWRNKWADDYKNKGEFKLVTGFVCKGIYTRNHLFNYPIQGPAFHCLLWAVIEMNKWLKKNKMKSVIVSQIHDSILIDTHLDEFDNIIPKLKQIMTEDIRKAWHWITVPLAIDGEISEKNWYEKKEIEL